MEKEIIKEIGTKIGADIFVKIVVFTKDSWKVEFEALNNIKIPQGAIDGMVLEGVYFAIYYIQQRSKGIFSNEEEKQFIENLKKYIIWALSELYFESLSKESDREKHIKNVDGLVNEYFDKRMKAYADFQKGNIAELFKKYLKIVFNSNDFRIKFMENTFKNRTMLSIAKIFGGSNTNFSKDIILNMKTLEYFVKQITDSLFEINIQKIVMEEKNSKNK